MNSETPALELSDILVPLSPITEQHADTASRSSRESSPEPLDANEIERMHQRALELQKNGNYAAGNGKGKERELPLVQELADMIIRLTSPTQSSLAQVEAQADTISQLMQQRQVLLERVENDRLYYESEKESWSLAATALIRQATRSGPNLYKQDNELNKHASALENENANLRQKLANVQNKVHTLELELSKLKPILFMKPEALLQSFLSSEVLKAKSPEKEVEPVEPPAFSDPLVPATDAPVTPKQKSKASHSRIPGRALFTTSPNGKHRAKNGLSSLGALPPLSDARSEHLLLAARKIGRKRATILSSTPFVAAARHDDEIAAAVASASPMTQPVTPKTPQKPPPAHSPKFHHFQPPVNPTVPVMRVQNFVHAPHSYTFVPGHPYPMYPNGPGSFGVPLASPPRGSAPNRPPIPYVVNSSQQAGPSAPSLYTFRANIAKQPANKSSAQEAMAGPFTHVHTTAMTSPPKSSGQTSLESLLNAATTVLSPASEIISSTGMQKRGRPATRSAEMDGGPASPTPKRRKVAIDHAAPDDSQGLTERSRSALDVLADQAAVTAKSGSGNMVEESDDYSSSQGPHYKRSARASKKSGKQRDPGRSNGKGKAKAKSKGASAGPSRRSTRTRMRSPTPQSDARSGGSGSDQDMQEYTAPPPVSPSRFRLRSVYAQAAQAPDATTDHLPRASSVPDGIVPSSRPAECIPRSRSAAPPSTADDPGGGPSSTVRSQPTSRAATPTGERSRQNGPGPTHDDVRQRWLSKLGMPPNNT